MPELRKVRADLDSLQDKLKRAQRSELAKKDSEYKANIDRLLQEISENKSKLTEQNKEAVHEYFASLLGANKAISKVTLSGFYSVKQKSAATSDQVVSGFSSGASAAAQGADGQEIEEEIGGAEDLFDYEKLKESERVVHDAYASTLTPMAFEDLTQKLGYDEFDRLRREELDKTTFPSFYQLCVSGVLPKLDGLLQYFKAGQIDLSFKKELEKINTSVLIGILKETADAYNKDLRANAATPEKQKVMQSLLFEAIKKTIAEFDIREENQIKEIKLEVFKSILAKEDGSDQLLMKIKDMIADYEKKDTSITSKQIEDEIIWYNFTHHDNQIKLQYSDEQKNHIRDVKRKSLLEKNAAIACMIKLVQEPERESQIKLKAQLLKEKREQLKKVEIERRTNPDTRVIRTRLKDGNYLPNEKREAFTAANVLPIEKEIQKLINDIGRLRLLGITEDFSSYQSSDHLKVGDLMERMYQQAFGADDFGPQKQDIDALRQLHQLSSIDFQVGRKELQQHYDRILENFGVNTPSDIALKNKPRDFHEYMRVRNSLFAMRDYLYGSYGESFLAPRQFDAYMQELTIENTDSFGKAKGRKLGWRETSRGMSMLVLANNTPVCSVGGARRREDEGGYYSQTMLINLGNFGDIKFGFNPITGKPFAIKKETSGKWTEMRSGVLFEYFKRIEGKGGYQDESTISEFINERDVERIAGILVGVVSRQVNQEEKMKLASQKGITTKESGKTKVVLPIRFSPEILQKSGRPAQPNEYIVNLTVQELLPRPRDLKDEIEALSIEERSGRTDSQYNIDQCLTRFAMAVEYVREAYFMMAADDHILHLDIKPKNYQGKHFDFGTSKVIRDGSYEDDDVKHDFDFIKGGTPEYMAPELYVKDDPNLLKRLELEKKIEAYQKLITIKKSLIAALSGRQSLKDLKGIQDFLTAEAVKTKINYEYMMNVFGLKIPDKKAQNPASILEKIKEKDLESPLKEMEQELKNTIVIAKANYKADIYSIGASIFGRTRAGVYLDTFYMRKKAYPDYHQDSKGKFKIIRKEGDKFIGRYYSTKDLIDNGNPTGDTVEFGLNDYIPIGKEFAEKGNKFRQGYERKGFESEGIKILEWAQKVALDNPDNPEAQDIVKKLESICDAMLHIDPSKRARLKPIDPSKPDLENGLTLLEITQRLEIYGLRLSRLQRGTDERTRKLFQLLEKGERCVDGSQSAVLENDYLTVLYDRKTIIPSQSKQDANNAPLLNLFIEELPEHYVEQFIQKLFAKIDAGSLATLFREQQGLESALLVAIKHNKPKVFMALINNLPVNTISNILTKQEFNNIFAENQWLLHYLAKQNLTSAMEHLLKYVKEKGSVDDKQAIKIKLLQNPFGTDSFPIPEDYKHNKDRIEFSKYNPVIWAIWHKNYELLQQYCDLLGADQLIKYRVYGFDIRESAKESLLHFATKQSDKRAYDILMKAMGDEFDKRKLLQAEFIPAEGGVSPLHYAFEDCPQLVQQYLENITEMFGDKKNFLEFLINNKNVFGVSPLLLAIKGNNKVLLQKIFDFIDREYSQEDKTKLFAELRNKDGKHALAYAVINNNYEIFEKITNLALSGVLRQQGRRDLINKMFIKPGGVNEFSVLQHLLLDENRAHAIEGQNMLWHIRKVIIKNFSSIGSEIFIKACREALETSPEASRSLFMQLATKGSFDILNSIAAAPEVEGDYYRAQLNICDDASGDTVFLRIMQEPDAEKVQKSFPIVLAACMRRVAPDTAEYNRAVEIVKANLFKLNKRNERAIQKVLEHGEDFTRAILTQLAISGVEFSDDERKLIDSYYQEKNRSKDQLIDWKALKEQVDLLKKSKEPSRTEQPIVQPVAISRNVQELIACLDKDKPESLNRTAVDQVVAEVVRVEQQIAAVDSNIDGLQPAVVNDTEQLRVETSKLQEDLVVQVSLQQEIATLERQLIVTEDEETLGRLKIELEELQTRYDLAISFSSKQTEILQKLKSTLQTKLQIEAEFQAQKIRLEEEKNRAVLDVDRLTRDSAAKLAAVQAKSSALEDRIRTLQEQLSQEKQNSQEFSKLKRELSSAADKLASVTREKNRLQDRVVRLEASIKKSVRATINRIKASNEQTAMSKEDHDAVTGNAHEPSVMSNLHSIMATATDILDKLAAEKEKIKQLEAQHAGLKEALHKKDENLAEKEAELAEIRQNIEKANIQAGQDKAQIAALTADKTANENSVRELQQKLAEAEIAKRALQEKNDRLGSTNDGIQEQLKEQQAFVDDLRGQLAAVEAIKQQQYEKLVEAIAAMGEQHRQAQILITDYEIALRESSVREQESAFAVILNKAQIAELIADKTANENSVRELQQKLAAAQIAQRELQEKNDQLGSTNADIKRQLEQQQAVVDDLRRQLASVDAIKQQQNEKLGQAITAMHEQNSQAQNLVIDYERALRESLGLEQELAFAIFYEKWRTSYALFYSKLVASEALQRASVISDEAAAWAEMMTSFSVGFSKLVAPVAIHDSSQQTAVLDTAPGVGLDITAGAVPEKSGLVVMEQSQNDEARRGHRKIVTVQFKNFIEQPYTVIAEPGKEGLRAIVAKESYQDNPIAVCADVFEMARRAGSKPNCKPQITIGANTKDPVLAATFYLIAKQFEKEGLVTINAQEAMSVIDEGLKDGSVKNNIIAKFSLSKSNVTDADGIDSKAFVQNFMTIYSSKLEISSNSNTLNQDQQLVRSYFRANNITNDGDLKNAERRLGHYGGLFNVEHCNDTKEIFKKTYGCINQLEGTAVYGSIADQRGLIYEEANANQYSAKDAVTRVSNRPTTR